MEESAFKKKTSIRIKLILITTIILAVTLVSMILLASEFFSADTSSRIKSNNHTIADIIGNKILSDFYLIIEKARLMVASVQREDVSPPKKNRGRKNPGNSLNTDADQILSGDHDILFIARIEKSKTDRLSVLNIIENRQLLQTMGIEKKRILSLFGRQSAQIIKGFRKTDHIINTSPFMLQPSLAIIKPYLNSKPTGGTDYIVIFISMDKFLKTVDSPDIIKKFIVNSDGDILAHYDASMAASAANLSEMEIVKKMQQSKHPSVQVSYYHNNQEYQGTFRKIDFAGIGVISTVAVKDAYRSVELILENNLYFTIIALAIAVLLLYFFAKTLTSPIRALVTATREIEKGNYDLDIRPTTKDEIGVLTHSFVKMSKGLAEREKIKDAFGKFVHKEIAEQVLAGDIKLGGERKRATIFFSDIRSFTRMSENLQPEEVVEFLNAYMSEMVECVNITHGVVDKFIGDAIMAVWGTPVSHGNDTENAIDAALMMRKRLKVFNIGRGDKKRPVVEIGCGINSGEVLAGQIGSKDRMEYTVIGDAVNLASRIEALNKPFGTDILITQDCYDEVHGIYRVGKMDKILVKGKVEPQQIYAVLGRKDDPETPKSMKELRSKLGTKKMVSRDKSHLKEEKKYEII